MATIREIRESLRISRRQLADMTGVSHATLVRIEIDPSIKPTEEALQSILKVLSEKIGREITKEEVGIETYNVMRDRRQRGTKREE